MGWWIIGLVAFFWVLMALEECARERMKDRQH